MLYTDPQRERHMVHPRPLSLLVLLILWPMCSASMAQDDLTISKLTHIDLQYMQQQRDSLNALTARNFGGQLNGSKDKDLALLQRLLDENIVSGNQTSELQAMGIVMGDLLASELSLDWVVYEDRYGRTRALRYKSTDSYLFPVTMISRRREVDDRTPVADIYRRARDTLRAAIPALPFQ
jgi:hypothetical protein